MATKRYLDISVLDASRQRVVTLFDEFENIYISFSGGKDSSVMTHLILAEARKRNRKVGLLIIDLECQYKDTIDHVYRMVEEYKDNIELHWFCGELLMRNAVSNYEPRWICWDESRKADWIREKPPMAADLSQYDFYVPKMEFEELIIVFGEWYCKIHGGGITAACIGIRADESLHRYRAIVSRKEGIMYKNLKWTTMVSPRLYNIYPIYDWKTEDIWIFHGKYPHLHHNKIYDKMNMAGVKLSQQRLCQPFGDDQRKGLWLYHILEPITWGKLIARVNGANSGAIYIQENGNMTGYNQISLPPGHTWKSFCNMLLKTMPKKTSMHYRERFEKFIYGWKARGYETIPDEAPPELEAKCWVPSWRRMCKTILRNDYWTKGLGQAQPKSEAYGIFKDMKKSGALTSKKRKKVPND